MHRIVVEVEDEALAGMELADGLDEVIESLRARRGELVAGISTRNSASALVRFGEFPERAATVRSGPLPGSRRPRTSLALPRTELAHKPRNPRTSASGSGISSIVFLVTQAEAEPAVHPELCSWATTSTIAVAAGAGFEAALLEEGGARRFEGDAAARRRVRSLVEVARWLAVRG